MPQYLRQQSLEDRVAELERRLAELTRTNQVGSTTLTNGTLLIRQGGRIQVMSAEDPTRTVAIIGDIGMPDANGTPQMGLQLRRDTPSNELLFAQQMAGAWAGTGFPTQGLAMYDRAGNVIISADTTSGKGASFPQRLVPFAGAGFFASPRTSATTWQDLLVASIPGDTPRLSLVVGLLGDQIGGVNTGGNYRILVNSTTVVASGTIPANFTWMYPSALVDMTPWYGPGTSVRVAIQVQRTSGATTGGTDGNGGSIRAEMQGALLIGS
ncbi:hypothetical protein [Streptomyces sp. Y1]|uniref:DUF1983 domain-containing protein n=1 Tax=Streptomyces sp. Y1 TaxID=3238634 RepID=A0AB39TJK8_9ACTN